MGGRRFYTPAGTTAFCRTPADYTDDGTCTAEDFVKLQLRLTSGLSLALSLIHISKAADCACRSARKTLCWALC